ncbi:MAG: protein kinase family protein [Pseudomonadota bacterium]
MTLSETSGSKSLSRVAANDPIKLGIPSNLQRLSLQTSAPQPIWMPWWEKIQINPHYLASERHTYINKVIEGIRNTSIPSDFFNANPIEQIQNEIETLLFIADPGRNSHESLNNNDFLIESFLAYIKPVIQITLKNNLNIKLADAAFDGNLHCLLYAIRNLSFNKIVNARLNKDCSRLKYSLIRTSNRKIFALKNHKQDKLNTDENNLEYVANLSGCSRIRYAINLEMFDENIIVKKVHPKIAGELLVSTEFNMHSYISENITGSVELLGAALVPRKAEFNNHCMKNQDSAYLFMPEAQQDLFDFFNINGFSLSVANTIIIMKEAAKIIAEMHNNNIFHGDIKLENFLIFKHKSNDFDLKICDFGFSAKEEFSIAYQGTQRYMAPEILLNKPKFNLEKKYYSVKSADIYALGKSLEFIVLATNLSNRLNISHYIKSNLEVLIRYCVADNPVARPDINYVVNFLDLLARQAQYQT